MELNEERESGGNYRAIEMCTTLVALESAPAETKSVRIDFHPFRLAGCLTLQRVRHDSAKERENPN